MSTDNVEEAELVGVVQDALQPHFDWPVEFERKRRERFELWNTCHVPLVHRTYFFLLFRGDPSDSVYMEVEIRRLSFLKGEKGAVLVTPTSRWGHFIFNTNTQLPDWISSFTVMLL